MSKNLMGILFAVAAATCNALIGVFSKRLFQTDLSPAGVSFYKCLIAFLVLSVVALVSKEVRSQIVQLWQRLPAIALCAFLGIFVLYFFETTAYRDTLVPIVVFALLGASAIMTFLASTLLLSERKSRRQYLGLVLALAGLALMFMVENMDGLSGGFSWAMVAGSGYGLFLVLARRLALPGGLGLVWFLVGFGTLYLSIPYAVEGVATPTPGSLPALLALAILPTIGGFYCTTKALDYIGASKALLFELTEPIFATLFAFIFLSELIRGAEWMGAALILLALRVSEKGEEEPRNESSDTSPDTSPSGACPTGACANPRATPHPR